MIDWEDHIDLDSEVMGGKPVIKGTRLTVDHLVGILKRRWTLAQIVEEYPGITTEDVAACVAYAAEIAECEEALKEAKEQGTISFADLKKEFDL